MDQNALNARIQEAVRAQIGGLTLDLMRVTVERDALLEQVAAFGRTTQPAEAPK